MNIHAIVSSYSPTDFGLASPQLPHLFAGDIDESAYRGERLTRLLLEAGAPKEFQLQLHRQLYACDDDYEWFIRSFFDPSPSDRASRFQILAKFRSLLDATHEPIRRATPSPTGEVTFVIARLEDTVQWISEQMFPGDVLTIVAQHEETLFTFALSNSPDAFPDARIAPSDATIGDLLSAENTRMTAAEPMPTVDFLSDAPLPRIRNRAPALVCQ